jgi:RimJ/RimL family protein N-acetyltransferase
VKLTGQELADEQIVLRPFTEEDVPAIVAACQDSDIPRWTRVPAPYTDQDARAFIANASLGAFAIVHRESGELVGSIGLVELGGDVGEIGYWMKREARGQGVATRALRLIVRWAARERGIARIQLTTEPDNVASQRVAEKAGFQREGLLRSWMEIKGRRRDVLMYSLLPEDLRDP